MTLEITYSDPPVPAPVAAIKLSRTVGNGRDRLSIISGGAVGNVWFNFGTDMMTGAVSVEFNEFVEFIAALSQMRDDIVRRYPYVKT